MVLFFSKDKQKKVVFLTFSERREERKIPLKKTRRRRKSLLFS
jgi:hypothetical protein